MKIKVIMSDKAMSRETMDARERMLKAALSSDAEVSVDLLFLQTSGCDRELGFKSVDQ